MLRAALVLGAAVLAVAGLPAPTPPDACSAPHRLASTGPIPAVRCTPGATTGGVVLPPLAGSASLLFGRALDLNAAAPESLGVLPGIGPRRAAAIVGKRREAAFRSVDDLQRVAGIGPQTVARLGGWVRAGAGGEEPRAERVSGR